VGAEVGVMVVVVVGGVVGAVEEGVGGAGVAEHR
jgi:hypothetical protein